MTKQDLINAAFEFGGSIFTWMNAYHLYKDRQVKGVFSPAFIFFAIWGLWNLFYYPHLDQMLSFYAGIILVVGNVLWCIMYFYLKAKRKKYARYPLTYKECFKPDSNGK